MRRNYRRARQIVSLGALAVVLIIGGTLAYFNQDLSASNVFLTGKYDTDLHEEFKPPGDWQPGVEIPKKVDIKNKGNVDVVAAARITESCVRKEDVFITTYETVDGQKVERQEQIASKGDTLPLQFEASDGTLQDFALKNFGSDVVLYEESKSPDEYMGKWVYTYDKAAKAYYFLYMGLIEGGRTSPGLLESVTMNPNAQATVTHTKLISDYDKENKKDRYTFSYDTNSFGYDSAEYRLNITAKTVQATKDAVDEVLAGNRELVPESFDKLVASLKEMCR